MRLSSLIITFAGFAVAGGSVYVAQDYLQTQQTVQTTLQEQAIVRVVVADRDIVLGQPIEAQLLTTIDWPAASVPEGVFTNFDELIAAPGADPRRARGAIAAGELILASRVSEFGEKVTIVQTLADGHRAMAIEVDAETAVGGFVTPGDYVDVVLTHGRNQDLRAVTILQNIRILGVDQDSNERSDAPEIARTVTVEVTPNEGQRLALAQHAGTLSLSLRTQAVEEDSPLEVVRLSDILQEITPEQEEVSTTTVIVRRAGVLESD